MEVVLLITTVLCYVTGAIGYLVYIMHERDAIHRISWGALFVGAILQTVAIVFHSIEAGHLAVINSHEALSFFAWVLVVMFLVTQGRFHIRIMGAFISPLAVIFMLVSSVLPNSMAPQTGVLKSAWVFFHVAAYFTANALFGLAFCSGIMYLLQERQIKRKSFGHLYVRLPSLERLDRINYVCLLAGFPLMTIGLMTGFAYAGNVWRSIWSWDPKEIFSLVTWCIYAVLLHERLAVGWRGRRAAWLAIFGFSAVLITFLGVNLLMEGHHKGFLR
ncbi:MAG: c-type cytochrome biogenesis protein CcsB [Syntrophobacteraceae bacterium]